MTAPTPTSRVDPRWWLVAIGLGLGLFWITVAIVAIVLIGGDDATELGSSSTTENGWPVVTRCSVVMPEDLDR